MTFQTQGIRLIDHIVNFLVCLNRKGSILLVIFFFFSDFSVDNYCLPKNGENRNPCKNGGKCEFTNGDVKCVCPVEYEGPTCAGKPKTISPVLLSLIFCVFLCKQKIFL